MDKFNLGISPRTSTGLIPSNFRRKQDCLSTTDKWKRLPKQPPPELYQYRGDFINARNRKKLEAKKIVEQQAKLAAREKNAASMECSSITVIPPSSPRESPTEGNVGWDDNYKHNSFELTPDEKRQRADNKSRFNEFLRIEACKRHARASDKNKTVTVTETKPPQDDTKVKQKKPPVPRLSALARARAQSKPYNPPKAKPNSVNYVATTTTKSKLASKSNDEQVRVINKEGKKGKKYLDFISNRPPKAKALESLKEAASPHNDTLKEPDSNIKQSMIEDDDSMFRLQLERIVRRASDLVIEKEKHATMTFNSSSPTPSQLLSTTTPTAEVKESDMGLKANTTEVDMHSRHDRLNDLEMRLARISTSSFISDTTDTRHSSEETSSYYSGQMSRSVGTEVIPRVPFPMQPVPMKGQDFRWTNLNDHLHNSSDSECDASSFESKWKEHEVRQGNENFHHPSIPLRVVEPSVFPSRQFEVDEDEPLPRRYGHSSDVVDVDFFSLFG